MSTSDQHLDHTRTLQVPRTRGAVSGLLLVLAGLWGALVPFFGPSFSYSIGTDRTWVWSTARFWLEVLPGGVTVLGGLLLLTSMNRVSGSLGGWLAALAGAWFVVGQLLAPSWRIGDVGQPLSTTDSGRALAEIGYFYGLGAVIVFLASFALGRLSVVGVRDLRAARRREEQQEREALLAKQRAEDERRADEERAAADKARAEREAEEQRERDNSYSATPETLESAPEGRRE